MPIFSAHVPSRLTGEQDPERALRKLAPGHTGWLCVTLGTNGAMLLEGDRLHHSPAFVVDAVDTTGAGDMFRAAFIYALLQSSRAPEILQICKRGRRDELHARRGHHQRARARRTSSTCFAPSLINPYWRPSLPQSVLPS